MFGVRPASYSRFFNFERISEEGINKKIKALEKSLEKEQLLKKELLEYEFNRLEEDRLSYQNQSLFKQLTYLIALFAALLIALVLVITFRAQDSANQATIEKQNSNILLANYKNRIRPHFLFNQLNNVNGFISQEKWDEAQEYLVMSTFEKYFRQYRRRNNHCFRN